LEPGGVAGLGAADQMEAPLDQDERHDPSALLPPARYRSMASNRKTPARSWAQAVRIAAYRHCRLVLSSATLQPQPMMLSGGSETVRSPSK
jgi:hypothetical protein